MAGDLPVGAVKSGWGFLSMVEGARVVVEVEVKVKRGVEVEGERRVEGREVVDVVGARVDVRKEAMENQYVGVVTTLRSGVAVLFTSNP